MTSNNNINVLQFIIDSTSGDYLTALLFSNVCNNTNEPTLLLAPILNGQYTGEIYKMCNSMFFAKAIMPKYSNLKVTWSNTVDPSTVLVYNGNTLLISLANIVFDNCYLGNSVYNLHCNTPTNINVNLLQQLVPIYETRSILTTKLNHTNTNWIFIILVVIIILIVILVVYNSSK